MVVLKDTRVCAACKEVGNGFIENFLTCDHCELSPLCTWCLWTRYDFETERCVCICPDCKDIDDKKNEEINSK